MLLPRTLVRHRPFALGFPSWKAQIYRTSTGQRGKAGPTAVHLQPKSSPRNIGIFDVMMRIPYLQDPGGLGSAYQRPSHRVDSLQLAAPSAPRAWGQPAVAELTAADSAPVWTCSSYQRLRAAPVLSGCSRNSIYQVDTPARRVMTLCCARDRSGL